MSYGWLSESTLPLRKPKPINVPDESNEPLRQIINEHLTSTKTKNKKKKKFSQSKINDPYDVTKTDKENKSKNKNLDSNKGVEERDKKDKETKEKEKYNKILAKKAEIYEKFESGKFNEEDENIKILNNSLVDFRKKRVQGSEALNSVVGDGATCNINTPNLGSTSCGSNIDDLRSRLEKIKRSKKSSQEIK